MSFLSLPVTGWIFLVVFFVLLTFCVKPLGLYMTKVYKGERTFLSPLFCPIEKLIYWACGTSPAHEMNWQDYTRAVFVFSLVSFVLLFSIICLQSFPNISLDLAFNTAASFVTNTGWQSYTPETTITPHTETLGIVPHAVISGGVESAIMIAVIRGLSQSYTRSLGNFWVDITRSILYIILPISLIFALFYISQGSIQTFTHNITFQSLEDGIKQTIIAGPVASFTSVKILTGSGGGYYAANSAHPYANPTALSDFIQLINMVLLQIAATVVFGRFVGSKKQGRSLYISMLALFIPLMLVTVYAEHNGNPLLERLNIDQSLGQMEGKELRTGTTSSALWASLTTATASGSSNASIDAFTPIGTMIPLIFMHSGEVIFGGIGSGLYSMLIYVILAVFIGSLMIGRSPEFLGKKIGVFEIQMAVIVILIPTLLSLIGTAIAVMTEQGQLGTSNPMAQGFSQLFYAFSSSAANNGSSLSGLHSDTIFYNLFLGSTMLISRFGVIWAVLSLAGSMGQKVRAAETRSTLDTTSNIFIILLIAVVVLIDILTFMPSLALGPIAAHFQLMAGG